MPFPRPLPTLHPLRLTPYALLLIACLLVTACTTPPTPTPPPPTNTPITPSPTTQPPPPTNTPITQSPTPTPATNLITNYQLPITIPGADLPALLGLPPARLAAFRYFEGAWQQVPLQIDEQLLIDLRDFNGRNDEGAPVFTYYADPENNPDPDPAFDADDELVVLTDALGAMAVPFTPPPGVDAAGATAVQVNHPLAPGGSGVIYLFAHDGSLDSAAGHPPIHYKFKRAISEPTPKGEVGAGSASPVEEDSWVTTPNYRHHFSASWIMDELYLPGGGAPEANLVDRFRAQIQPGDCDRSEDTFAAGNNHYIVNKSGPVRALRSYIGANSGVYTQRLHRFYRGHQELVTDVRVHALRGIMFFVDYSPAAAGMRYYNSFNPDGVPVDGIPDDLDPGPPLWELVTGDPGSLVITHQLTTDIPNLNREGYYLDDDAPNPPPCTGDEAAYAQSGYYFYPLPCTDPARAVVDPRNCATAHTFTLHQRVDYAPAPLTATDAATRAAQVTTPPTITVTVVTP